MFQIVKLESILTAVREVGEAREADAGRGFPILRGKPAFLAANTRRA